MMQQDAPTSALADHHDRCDDQFADAEAAARAAEWPDCRQRTATFRSEMLAHFRAEEEVLFPAFEEASGGPGGPTSVMRMEHAQMRALLDDLEDAAAAGDADAYAGHAETLLILMRQHNLKEENILYPMCDRALAGDDALAKLIAKMIGDHAHG